MAARPTGSATARSRGESNAGVVGDVNVAGLAVALVYSYDDDETGSPWTLVLHVDQRGSREQQGVLADLFLGRLPGSHMDTLPWIRKARHLVDVRSSAIEHIPEGDGHRLRVGDAISVRATGRVEDQDRVSCIVPGYERIGTELVAEELVVDDGPFRVGALRKLRLRCGLRVLLVAPS